MRDRKMHEGTGFSGEEYDKHRHDPDFQNVINWSNARDKRDREFRETGRGFVYQDLSGDENEARNLAAEPWEQASDDVLANLDETDIKDIGTGFDESEYD